MKIGLNYILSELHITNIVRQHNETAFVNYADIIWLGTFHGNMKENIIYIGYASQLPSELPSKNIGLILINDCSKVFSDYKIEIIELSQETNLAELCLQIQDKYFHNAEELEITELLLTNMFNNCSIKVIIDIAYEYLNNPIMAQFTQNEQNFFYSCETDMESEFDISEAILLERKASVGYPEMRNDIMKKLELPLPVIIEDGNYFKGKRRILISITNGTDSKEHLGVIAVFEVNRPFTSKDITLITILRNLISQKCNNPGFNNKMTNLYYEQKIQDLLRGQHMGKNTSWISALFGKGPYHFITAIMDIKKLNDYRIDDLKYSLLRELPFSISVLRGSYLILITNSSNRPDHLWTALESLSETYHISVGLSAYFNNLSDLRKHYTQAKMANKYGNHYISNAKLYRFETLKTEILLNELMDKTDFRIFFSNDLERLIEYDQTENTEYYKTLKTYLDCGLNKEEARKKLNIHRNTLPYRLERIEEILGYRLDNGNAILNTYLSDAIRKIYAQTNSHINK